MSNDERYKKIEKNANDILEIIKKPKIHLETHEAYFFINNIKEFSEAVKKIPDVFFKKPASERDRLKFHDKKEEVNRTASEGITIILNQFNPENLSVQSEESFKDHEGDNIKMSKMVTESIRILKPMFRNNPMGAAVISPYEEIKKIAIDIFKDMIKNDMDIYRLFDKDILDKLQSAKRAQVNK